MSRVSEAERLRRYMGHNCVSELGPGWNDARANETICGLCGSYFYWDRGYCNERKTRREFPFTEED